MLNSNKIKQDCLKYKINKKFSEDSEFNYIFLTYENWI